MIQTWTRGVLMQDYSPPPPTKISILARQFWTISIKEASMLNFSWNKISLWEIGGEDPDLDQISFQANQTYL